MNPASSPAPNEVLAHYTRLQEALRALVRDFKRTVSDPTSAFFGMVRDEFDATLAQTRDELDKQTVMMLVASCEALFRRDCDHRAADRRLRQDPVAERLRALTDQARSTGTRVKLGDIFTAWETETHRAQLFRHLRSLMRRRHWLAHGRYWTDKSGFPPDPARVFDLISAVCSALAAHSGDFPRLHL